MKQFWIILFAFALLNSCTTYYNPKVVYIPLIREKGDNRLNAGVFMAQGSQDAGLAGFHGTF